MVKSKGNLDMLASYSIKREKNTQNHIFAPSIGKKLQSQNTQQYESNYLKPFSFLQKQQTEDLVNFKSSPLKKLNLKNEKFIEENVQTMKKKVEKNLKEFEVKMTHELSIISFLEDLYPVLENMKNNYQTDVFSVFGVILSKYIAIRVKNMLNSIEKKDNIFNVTDWSVVQLFLHFDQNKELWQRKLVKALEMIKNFNSDIVNYISNDSIIQEFLENNFLFNNQIGFYRKSFLALFMSISDFLEKGKKFGASKFCYAFILRSYYFLLIYHMIGFNDFDPEEKINIDSMRDNLGRFETEAIKLEIIKVFKMLYH